MEGNMKKFIKYMTLFAIVSLLAGCSNEDSKIKEYETRIAELENQVQSILAERERTEDISILKEKVESNEKSVRFVNRMIFDNALFSRDNIRVDDMVADMKLTEIKDEMGEQFLFSGEKTLTGRFEILENDEYYGEDIFFYLDDKLTGVLPREKSDVRDIWFRFSNYDEALELLKPFGTSGEVTIKIDQYRIDLLESEVVNEARITGVAEN